MRLTGFIDEINPDLWISSVIARALGLQSADIRFVRPAGADKPKNVRELSAEELAEVARLLKIQGMAASSIGSPIGKVRLYGPPGDDLVEVDAHMERVVIPCFDAAERLNALYVRVFGGYLPEGGAFETYAEQAAAFIARLAAEAEKRKRPIALEPERGLAGATCAQIAKLIEMVGSDWVWAVFDGANLAAQGLTPAQIYEDFQSAEAKTIAVHAKDIDQSDPALHVGRVALEKDLRRFVPIGEGTGAYHQVMRKWASLVPGILKSLTALVGDRAVIYVHAEPHMNRSEQFFGSTSPDNFLLAVNAMQSLCEMYGLETDRYSIEDLRRSWPS
jgi:sugar phosphate isomerase/epimerase